MSAPPTATGVHRATLLRAFARARWGYRFADRRAFLAWQAERLRRFCSGPLRRAPFYGRLANSDLTALPVVTKATMLGEFAAFNSAGVSLADALAVAERAERERDFAPTLPGGLTVGLSSGTSGQRGVFLVSARERSVWAGTILARVLAPGSLRRLLNPLAPALRVAFFLRASSNLYTSVHSRRLHFTFCDLLTPLDAHRARLAALQPEVLIAPASVLRALAEAQLAGALRIAPTQVVSVAEVLEADDAEAVLAAWHVPTAQVYQCTEGLLGQTCAHGSLHLNEEFVHFEPEWLDDARTRFVPRITDFTRETQVFARFRLDDVLRVAPGPCACGRVTLRLAAVEGRCDDVLWLPSDQSSNLPSSSALQPVFPDVLRRAMVLAVPDCPDWRLTQQGLGWTVRLHPSAADPDARAAVIVELRRLWASSKLTAPALHFAPWEPEAPAQKRRRIRCLERPLGASPPTAITP